MNNPLLGRIQAMVSRVVVRRADPAPMMQELQVDLLDDETQDAAEHFEPYGFTARPYADAEGIMLAVGGLRGHGLVINVADRRYRVRGLAEGEVAIHDDQDQVVHLKRDGIVIHGKALTLESEGDMTFSAEGEISFSATGNFSVEGADFTVDASGQAEISANGTATIDGSSIAIGAGASLAAARVTDTVNDDTDRISGGSSKVRIE